eukprot:GHVL01043114.1.p1 GENE.GHVL01043114.1~~GHVL01043114.1.p1  ORF type:complete len:387 (+),score=108.20 GHVL01043114.1:60-1220(+)
MQREDQGIENDVKSPEYEDPYGGMFSVDDDGQNAKNDVRSPKQMEDPYGDIFAADDEVDSKTSPHQASSDDYADPNSPERSEEPPGECGEVNETESEEEKPPTDAEASNNGSIYGEEDKTIQDDDVPYQSCNEHEDVRVDSPGVADRQDDAFVDDDVDFSHEEAVASDNDVFDENISSGANMENPANQATHDDVFGDDNQSDDNDDVPVQQPVRKIRQMENDDPYANPVSDEQYEPAAISDRAEPRQVIDEEDDIPPDEESDDGRPNIAGGWRQSTKKGSRKKNDGAIFQKMQEQAHKYVELMRKAGDEDKQKNREGKPAIHRMQLATSVFREVVKPVMKEHVIAEGIFGVLDQWTDRLPDGSNPNLTLTKKVFDAILALQPKVRG